MIGPITNPAAKVAAKIAIARARCMEPSMATTSTGPRVATRPSQDLAEAGSAVFFRKSMRTTLHSPREGDKNTALGIPERDTHESGAGLREEPP